MEKDKHEHKQKLLLAERSEQENIKIISSLECQIKQIQGSPTQPKRHVHKATSPIQTNYNRHETPWPTSIQHENDLDFRRLDLRIQELEKKHVSTKPSTKNINSELAKNFKPATESPKVLETPHNPPDSINRKNSEIFPKFKVTISPPITARKLMAGETLDMLMEQFLEKQVHKTSIVQPTHSLDFSDQETSVNPSVPKTNLKTEVDGTKSSFLEPNSKERTKT